MTKPKTSDQNTDVHHAARHGDAGLMRLLGCMRRGVEAGDGVKRIEKADQEGHEGGRAVGT